MLLIEIKTKKKPIYCNIQSSFVSLQSRSMRKPINNIVYMKHIRILVAVLVTLAMGFTASSQTLYSPDGRLEARFMLVDSCPEYALLPWKNGRIHGEKGNDKAGRECL